MGKWVKNEILREREMKGEFSNTADRVGRPDKSSDSVRLKKKFSYVF